MDGLKLDSWKTAFEEELKTLQVEYDAFLLPKKFEDTYKITTDEARSMLSLWVDSEAVPNEIETRMFELLVQTEPEDSV